MTPEVASKIEKDLKFRRLINRRRRLSLSLTLIMLAVYYAFILLIAFSPEILGTPLGGSIISLGIPVGIGIIIIAFALMGIYVHRANTEFDALVEDIRNERFS